MPPRIGVVGLGTMGSNHASRLTNAGAMVVGTDINADARAAFADRFETQVYADHEAMYEDGLDGVVVTVPNAFHEEFTVSALTRDIPVLVEKPLAHTLESAERIADAARDSDAFCTVGLVMRYYDAVTELLDRAARGEFGTVHHVEANYLRRQGAPKRGWFTDPDLAGGGALLDVGIHVLDLAMAVLDFPAVTETFGCVRTERDPLPVEDSASGLVRFESGQSLALEVSWAAHCESAQSLVVRGDEGGAHLDIATQTLRVFPGDGAAAETVSTETSDWLAPEDEAFLAAVERNVPPANGTLEEALSVQRVVEALYRTGERKTVVQS
ncbi:Gfo/Idh/MocA family protein [Haladaptatus sp. GCM10025707]|uniref:Gfo/Idh/MocA family protein n=1 Tax=unclassified Haladaptatus TaxID=2622732 RepID=UPI0023E8455E|nr:MULTISPECIES: Gfo/Idh/MocA family oxidoreductase [unclassified Haladaptatus]